MDNWITDFMEQFGYIGIFLLIALENLFPPIPSEIILTFGGFMTTHTQLTVWGVVITATIGSVVGAICLYLVGLLLNVDRIEAIVDRWGHLLRVKKADVDKAYQWFDRFGYWTVFFCRMVPIVRSLISIPAGMARMRFSFFLLFTLAGTLIWNIVLVVIGAALGESWQDILKYMSLYSNIVLVLILLCLLGIVAFFLLRNRKNK